MYEQKEVKEMDELLYQYMPIVDEILCKNVPGSMNHEFSDRFEKRMNKLIRLESHSKTYRVMVGVCKRVAIILAAAMLLGLCLSGNVVALIEKFFSFTKTASSGGFWEYRFESYEEDDMAYIRKPEYIPEGFVLVKSDYSLPYWYQMYEGKTGEIIMVDNTLLTEDGIMLMDSDYDAEEKIIIQGQEATFITRNGNSAYYKIFWFEKNMMYQVYTSVDVPKEEVIKVAENMLQEEKIKIE